MTDISIVQFLSEGKTVKEIASLNNVKARAMEHRILLMRKKYFALTIHHLVAIFFRKDLIK